uniref:right-handed parallel beta-helix repeat-containing protein n=1 Tax=Marinobacterium profundum TaxID=1714300 RepID=UPI00082AD34A|nr:right-handed parallel beta-helix repeat-containing protein [Marinobacterium profundum]
MRALFWLTALLITYGSLYPFNFTLTSLQQPDHTIISLRIPGIGDLLGNLLLFAPLGALSYARATAQSMTSEPATLPLSFIVQAGLFPLVLQLLQLLLPERDPSFMDVILNLLGCTLGWYCARYLRFVPHFHSLALAALPIGIGALYFLSELSPFVPTIDLQSIKNSLKPLFNEPFAFGQLLAKSALWVVAVRLLFWQRTNLRQRGLLIIWAFILVAKLLIYKNSLELGDLSAPLLAWLVLRFLDVDSPKGLRLQLALLAGTIGFSSLGSFAPETGPFSLIPFSGLLQGQMHTNVASLLAKLYVFSALIWIAIEAGLKAQRAAILLSTAVLLLEILQIWIPSKTAEIGDPLLVWIAYAAVRHIGDFLARQPPHTEHTAEVITPSPPSLSPLWRHNRSLLLAVAITFAGFVIAIKGLLALPGIPYNLAQLFRNDGSLIDLACFYLTLAGIGIAPVWIWKHQQNATAVGFWYLIKNHFLAGSTIYILLWVAVSQDSLQDITGTVMSLRFLDRLQLEEGVLPVIFRVIGVSNIRLLIEFVEPGLRFMALLGLFQVPLCYLLFRLLPTVANDKNSRKLRTASVSLLLYGTCFYYSFAAASTDNLTELIASPPLLAATVFLFALAAALGIKVLNNSARHRPLKIVVVMAASTMVGWVLVQFALATEIQKYGATFSALDFILGPDRNTRLGDSERMLRWSFVSIAWQSVVLLGAWQALQLRLPAPKHNRPILARPRIAVSLLLVLSFSAYLSNRLFGEEQHWQTLATNLAKPDIQFAIDDSVATVPADAKPGQIMLNSQPMPNIATAFKRAKDNNLIEISAGHYRQAAVLTAHNVTIRAEKGAVLYGRAVEGKAALVLKGNNTTIEGLECHSISVRDGNGKCIRLEGKGVTLRNVYFHHAQGGILGSRKGGDIVIEDSLFEHLGSESFSHGVYSLSPTRLIIRNSRFLNNRNGAHEIKSRSFYTEITGSVVAAAQSRDSRLVDVSQGGVLILKNNIFIEGPFSENHDLLSWGVEGKLHPQGSIEIVGNLFISDKAVSNLISIRDAPAQLAIFNNVGVGEIRGLEAGDNLLFENREVLSISPSPAIPSIEKILKNQ